MKPLKPTLQKMTPETIKEFGAASGYLVRACKRRRFLGMTINPVRGGRWFVWKAFDKESGEWLDNSYGTRHEAVDALVASHEESDRNG